VVSCTNDRPTKCFSRSLYTYYVCTCTFLLNVYTQTVDLVVGFPACTTERPTQRIPSFQYIHTHSYTYKHIRICIHADGKPCRRVSCMHTVYFLLSIYTHTLIYIHTYTHMYIHKRQTVSRVFLHALRRDKDQHNIFLALCIHTHTCTYTHKLRCIYTDSKRVVGFPACTTWRPMRRISRSLCLHERLYIHAHICICIHIDGKCVVVFPACTTWRPAHAY